MTPATAVLFVAVPPNVKFSAEEKRALKSFATTLAKRVAAGRGFTCAITNDEALRNLNKTFRDRDYATDVLSFPASRDHSDWGDIAISAERAAEQAEHFGHSKLDEVRILMLHGVLHLTGMDHEHDGGEMARAESKWRAEFGLEQGLIERSSADFEAG
ncbi:MAG TPA: rRNA maturation RNase YbeY [Bryobacteraceae bacterium]